MRVAAVRRRSSLYSIYLACLGALLATTNLANAQAPNTPASSEKLQVYLVRQDSSDCSNSTVSNGETPLVSGNITIVRNPDGTTEVKVAMTASPDTVYHVYLKCVRQLGDLTTGDEGAGIQIFSFPTNLVGNVFAFDVYPEGAPRVTSSRAFRWFSNDDLSHWSSAFAERPKRGKQCPKKRI